MTARGHEWERKEIHLQLIYGASELWIDKAAGSDSTVILFNGGRIVLDREQVKAISVLFGAAR